MTTQTTRQPVVEEPATRIAAYPEDKRGAVEEDGLLATHLPARTTADHALRGESPKTRDVDADGNPFVPDETPRADRSLVEAVKASGWAVPVARRVEDIDSETLVDIARLSEDRVAHLFAAEAGGVVLAMAGSTAADRRRATERLSRLPERPRATRRVFGVLLDAGEIGSHYSEQGGWGLTGKIGEVGLRRELEAAADLFRASRAGSLAVAGTKAERRRIEANRESLRAGFVSRRRKGEELLVRPAREIDASRDAVRETHWTENAELERRVERACKSGRAAYDTARAVYLRQLPTLTHRLLHLLRREGGAVREREFVSRHAKLAGVGTPDPEAALVAALRELAGAGKLRRLLSRKTGEIFVAATEPLDEGDFRRSLTGLIRDGRFGIVNPWAETDGVEPEGEEGEEARLSGDHEDAFSEETGREVLLDRIADEGAREEIEAVTA